MRKVTIIIILIVLFYAINMILESKHSGVAFLIDPCTACYMTDLQYFYNIYDIILKNAVPLFYSSHNSPPIYIMSSALTVYLLGKHWVPMILINNGIYLIMLLVFLYLLGKHTSDRTTGVIAALLVSLYPLIYSFFDKYSLDFPLGGIIVMSIYFLLRSEFFLELKWSILFILSCGLGLLVKEPFGAFILAPILWGAGYAIKDVFNKKFKRLLNLALCTVILVLMLLTYYTGNFKWKVFTRLFENPSGTPPFSFENIRFFYENLWETLLSPPFLIILVFSLYIFIKKAKKDVIAVILLWILTPTLILFLIPPHKESRYFIPILPAFALISAFGIAHLDNFRKGLTTIICVLLAAVGIFQYYGFKYDLISLSKLRYGKFSYFNTNAINTSIAKMRNQYLFLEDHATAVVPRLLETKKPPYNRALKMLFISKDGDWRNVQEIMGYYLWYRYDIPIELMRCYEVCDNMQENLKELDKIDFIIFNEIADENAKGLNFNIVRKVWENKYATMTWDTATKGISGEDTWVQYSKQWSDLINEFTYYGLITKTGGYDVYLYVRKMKYGRPSS
ncbi:MAG: glycosyltransferase family 39 protein [Elusimicrobia bacterium]|nr:glycosyltransferase family 39 protein [Candidatus Liberimonas magnetica]